MRLETIDGRGLNLKDQDRDAYWCHRAFEVEQCAPANATTVLITESGAVEVIAGHHTLGYILDSSLQFSNWTNWLSPWQLNPESMTL